MEITLVYVCDNWINGVQLVFCKIICVVPILVSLDWNKRFVNLENPGIRNWQEEKNVNCKNN